MKKTLLMAIAIGLCSLVQAAENYWSVTLSTTNAVVFPRLKGYTAVDATNSTAYAAGSYVTMPNGKDYWTPDGGTYTTTNAPTHRLGADESADSITWYAIPSSINVVYIQLIESGDVWFAEGGGVAVNGKTHLLTGKGMAWEYTSDPGSINALAGSTTKTVTITVR